MRRQWILPFSLLFSAPLFSQQQQPKPLVPPQQIEKEINAAEKEFKEAKKMFNPWYTGPLLTPSAHVLPPGYFVIQPYVFFTNNYAHFDEHGKSHRVPHLEQIKPSLSPFQFGITKWMDGTVSFGGVRNHQKGQTFWGWSDTTMSLGFGLLSETAYRPAIKFVVQESFPTGNFQKFRPEEASVASTGSGSFMTQFSLNISKVVWWLTLHPMNFRASFNYTVNSNVDVKGFNSYGGGKGTHGTVKGGNTFAFDFGYEYSFTKRWVAAFDFVYNYSSKNTFSGHTVAPVGGPFNDQISLAPAIEYNVTENLGFIAGVWFTVWGRNSSNFVSEVVSVTYTF